MRKWTATGACALLFSLINTKKVCYIFTKLNICYFKGSSSSSCKLIAVFIFLVFVSPAKHRDHFVRRLSVSPSVCHTFLSHFPELCFAGNTCIPRNAATFFSSDSREVTNLAKFKYTWVSMKCISPFMYCWFIMKMGMYKVFAYIHSHYKPTIQKRWNSFYIFTCTFFMCVLVVFYQSQSLK